MSNEHSEFRSGVVAVLGRPNVGKSTLVNALVGQKVSIVTPKPQTTRNRIQGILSLPAAQLVLVDTPGACDNRTALKRAMRKTIGGAAAEADVALIVIEARDGQTDVSERDREVIRLAKQSRGSLVLVVNKVDRLRHKADLLPVLEAYGREASFAALVPISALRADGLERLTAELVKLAPRGPALFPTEMVTDQTERFLSAELIREQLLLQMREEVPHGVAVVIDQFEDGREGDEAHKGLCRLEGRVVVERESQVGIVVGQGGQQIKAVSEAARRAIEELLDCKVYVRLSVVVDKNWTKNERAVERLAAEGLAP